MFISSDHQVGEAERRRRPNRRPRECPTVDQIKEKMGEGMRIHISSASKELLDKLGGYR